MKRKQKKKLEGQILKMLNKSSSKVDFKEIGDRLNLSKKKDLKILKKNFVVLKKEANYSLAKIIILYLMTLK